MAISFSFAYLYEIIIIIGTSSSFNSRILDDVVHVSDEDYATVSCLYSTEEIKQAFISVRLLNIRFKDDIQ